MQCQHELQVVANTLLKDGRNPLVVNCFKCSRSWQCESINFAPMGAPPKWVPEY